MQDFILMEKLCTIESQLNSISQLLVEKSSRSTDDNEVLNITQCGELTGFSTSTLYKYCCGREIPHYKSGKRLVFRRQEILDWMVSNPRKTIAEIEAEANQFVNTTLN